MASLGAKVLQTRSVSIAMSHGVPLQVLSSFENKPGTLVTAEDESMEKDVVSGIAFSRDEARVTLIGIPDRPGVAATIFGALGDAAINVDMIVQSRTVIDGDEKTDMTFTCGQADLPRALALMEEKHAEIEYKELESDQDVAKVSIVGVGMRTNSGVAKTMFGALAEKNINIKVITTSEIKTSVLVGADYLELAVRTLHDAFGLEGDPK